MSLHTEASARQTVPSKGLHGVAAFTFAANSARGIASSEKRGVVAVRRVCRDLAAQGDLLGGGALEALGLIVLLGGAEARGGSDDAFCHGKHV